MTLTLMALAGGVGVLARVEATAWLVARGRRATMAINLVGAAALGILVATEALDQTATTVVATGLLGGFTTFSTWMVEVVESRRASDLWLPVLVGIGAVGLAQVLW